MYLLIIYKGFINVHIMLDVIRINDSVITSCKAFVNLFNKCLKEVGYCKVIPVVYFCFHTFFQITSFVFEHYTFTFMSGIVLLLPVLFIFICLFYLFIFIVKNWRSFSFCIHRMCYE